MSGLSNGQQAILMLLVFILPVWITWTANSSPMDRTSLLLVASATLSGILAFIKEILGGKPSETTSTTTTQPSTTTTTVSRMSKLGSFFRQFMVDRSAMALHRRSKGKYDPDPAPPRHRRSHRGHRKGVEPAGLKRWRLSHRPRTHDPGRASTYRTGRRGGHYFSGPHKRRYDPAPPRRHFTRARRYGGKIEGALNKYGTLLGAAIGGAWGVFTGYNDYQTAYGPNGAKDYLNTIIGGDILDKNGTKISTKPAEIAHLWGANGTDSPHYFNTLTYLKYKFTGYQPDGTYTGSAWVYPFWAGFAMTIARPIAKLFTHKGDHILKPVQKIGIGMLGVSTAGALALPGCPKNGKPEFPAPTQANTLSMTQTQPGQYALAPPPQTREFTYKG